MASQHPEGDLTITAQYTSAIWHWAGFPYAELFIRPGSKWLFRGANLLVDLSRLWHRQRSSLRHSLVERHSYFDQIVAQHGELQVLEIAAGLSRRGATFTEASTRRYTEFDLPAMIATKQGILQGSERGRAILDRPHHRLVSGDAREQDFGALLDEGPGLVLTEGLMTYLDAPAQRDLWRRIAQTLRGRPGSLYAFDLIPTPEHPPGGRLGGALSFFLRRTTQGGGLQTDERSREDIRRELADAGLEVLEILDGDTSHPPWTRPFPERKTHTAVWLCRPSPA